MEYACVVVEIGKTNGNEPDFIKKSLKGLFVQAKPIDIMTRFPHNESFIGSGIKSRIMGGYIIDAADLIQVLLDDNRMAAAKWVKARTEDFFGRVIAVLSNEEAKFIEFIKKEDS